MRAITQRLLRLPFTWKASPDNSSFWRVALPASLCLLLCRSVAESECLFLPCVSARGEASVLLVPATAPPESQLAHPVPSGSPDWTRLYVCQAEESPSGTLLSIFLLGSWKTYLTALLIGSSAKPFGSLVLNCLHVDHIRKFLFNFWHEHNGMG